MPLTRAEILAFAERFDNEAPVRKDPLLRLYAVALEVLINIMGRRWARDHLFSAGGHAFLRNSADAEIDRLKHHDRIVSFADLLINLQDVPGFAQRIARLRTSDLESAIGELEGAKFLFLSDTPFGFVGESGAIGRDYDVDIEIGDPRPACEMKCKLEDTQLSESTIRGTLEGARRQLPDDRPGIVFVKIPEAWTRDPAVSAIMERALRRVFGSTGRISAVVFHWEEWHSSPSAGGIRLVRFRPELNQRARWPLAELVQILQRYRERPNTARWMSLQQLVAPSLAVEPLIAGAGPIEERPLVTTEDISIGDPIRHLSEYGIQRSHIERALRAPDLVEHLTVPNSPGADEKQFSLYAQHQGIGDDRFTLLVEVMRKSRKLVAVEAWRVYHSDLKVSESNSPYEMLEILADKYGIPFSLGNRRSIKFLRADVVPEAGALDLNQLIRIESADNEPFRAHLLVQRLPQRVIFVQMAFALDTSRYGADISKHR